MDFKDLLLNKKLTSSSKIYPGNSTQVFFYLEQVGVLTIENNQFNEPNSAMNYFLNADNTAELDGWRFWRVYDSERGELVPLEHLRASILSKNDTSIKTSLTHPLRLDAVTWPSSSGKIGLTICPGKQGQGLYSGIWKRDLQQDFDAIMDWPTATLITLMESHEFERLDIAQFEQTAKLQKFNWLHLPIEDMHTPDLDWMKKWPQISSTLAEQLNNHHNIVIHCRGGLGRSGIVAALLLIDQGVDNRQAVATVRQARPGAIETFEQEQFVLNYKKEK
jgi:protein-tyrosine phosphatase